DPNTWKRLALQAQTRWDDGTIDVVNVESLQPVTWLIENRAQVGKFVPLPLDLVDMGLPERLQAQVISVDPCPPITPGPGRVVLTTVNHLNQDVREVTVLDQKGHQETFRPTGAHRFYRENDQEWVHVDQLERGDLIRGYFGPLTVSAIRRIP